MDINTNINIESEVNIFKSMTIDERIDLFLRWYDRSERLLISNIELRVCSHILSKEYPRYLKDTNKYEFDLREDTFKMLLEKKLIYEEKEQLVDNDGKKIGEENIVGHKPTHKGAVINERGGWIKYRERKESDRTLTRDVGESVKTTNTFQKVSIGLTTLIIFTNMCIAYFSYSMQKHQLQSEEKRQQTKDIQSKEDSLLQLKQLHICQEYADHLFCQLDSLTTALKAKNAEQLK